MKPTSNLVNAREIARASPSTFSVPDQLSINELRPGDFVKICRNDERFWVKLTSVEGQGGRLEGTVANVLFADLNPDLGLEDPVSLFPKNIYAIEWGKKS